MKLGKYGRSEIHGIVSWRLDLSKLACQAGIVISFYDLSRLDPGPPSRAARTSFTGSYPPGATAHRDKTEGVPARNLKGATSSGPLVTAARNVQVKGQVHLTPKRVG